MWYVVCGVFLAERSEDKKQVQRQQLENWAMQQKQLGQVLILLALLSRSSWAGYSFY